MDIHICQTSIALLFQDTIRKTQTLLQGEPHGHTCLSRMLL